MRLQIVWGLAPEKSTPLSAPRLWRGSISVDQGEVSEIRVLGLDADQPGTFVLRDKQVLVEPRYTSSYTGIEVDVVGPVEGELELVLATPGEDDSQKSIRIPLTELQHDDFSTELDDLHRLYISRAPGDNLRVESNHEQLIFSPGEQVRLTLRPHLLEAQEGTTLRARLEVQKPEPKRLDVPLWSPREPLWSHKETLKVNATQGTEPLTDISFDAPNREGIYELRITLAHTLPTVGKKNVAERVIEFVVIDSQTPPRTSGPPTMVTEFNPAEHKWFETLTQLPQWRLLPLTDHGPWSNKTPEIWNHQDRQWTQLQGDGWVAYSLPVEKENIPHIVEVEFPAEIPQNVGISILQPEQEGGHHTVALDSTVRVGDPDLVLPNVSSPSQPARHSIVFWPNSNSNVVVISNRNQQGKASFGKIRLKSFPQGLPAEQATTRFGRKRIAVIDASLLKQLLSAKRAINEDTQIAHDTWQTFYDCGTRLVAYLRYAGYDGAAIHVFGGGSTLYPSKHTYPTPHYDNSVFGQTGADIGRKDVLALFLRLFDREGLTLIPSIEFTTPLPELETKLANGVSGVELFNVHGRRATIFRDASGRAAYYNPLNNHVQQAMQNVVQEITSRYAAHHTSFGGIQLRFDNVGYTQLPDAAWGFDNSTLKQFQSHLAEQNLKLTDQQISLILRRPKSDDESTKVHQTWLSWRATVLSDLYLNLATAVSLGDRKDRLYLALADLSNSTPWERHLRPTLPRRSSAEAALLDLGLNLKELSQHPNTVVLRPQRDTSRNQLLSQAVDFEVRQLDIQQEFNQGPSPATELFHVSQTHTLDRFIDAGPSSFRGLPVLTSVSTRLGLDSRRPFARSLAQFDDHLVFEGGATLPIGQEEQTNRFFRVFRRLPSVPFEPVELESADPLFLRKGFDGNDTFVYIVNTSPWSVNFDLDWKRPEGTLVEPLHSNPSRSSLGLSDGVDGATLEPYGLIAFRFSQARSQEVEIQRCHTDIPKNVARDLRIQVDEIIARFDALRKSRSPANLISDPGFESPLSLPEGVWTINHGVGDIVDNDYQVRAQGNSSLHMHGRKSTSVTSQEFAAPKTGRLVVSLKAKVANRQTKPVLLLRVLSSDPQYQPEHLFAVDDLTTDFREIPIRFPDLPTKDDLRLQLRFELHSPGEVWVDDVQLHDKWFVKDEGKAFDRILQVATEKVFNFRKSGRVDDLVSCYDTLDGYWPRFMLRHVPATQVAHVVRPTPRPSKSKSPASKPRFLDTMKSFIPKFPTFR